jgi:YVTN family beta-propeller protein
VIDTVHVATFPYEVAVNPTTNRVYVTHGSQTDMVSVIENDTLLTTVVVDGGPEFVAVNPSTNDVYVTTPRDTRITIIDGSTQSVSGKIELNDTPEYLALDPTNNHLYSGASGNSIRIINTTTNAVVANVGLGSPPFDLDVVPATRRVYVALANADEVAVIQD